jgi:CubicO group peptidase (beta-lactamase class C family)
MRRWLAQMLLNRGELDGVRILSRKIVEYMTTNHLHSHMLLSESADSGWAGGSGVSHSIEVTAMSDVSASGYAESAFDGLGFGLGFSVCRRTIVYTPHPLHISHTRHPAQTTFHTRQVMMDPIKACIVGSRGEYSWGGWASTAFWIDPAEDMVVMQLAQLTPSDRYPIRRQLKVLSYQTIVDSDGGNTLNYWES